jgi:hypothetical protein
MINNFNLDHYPLPPWRLSKGGIPIYYPTSIPMLFVFLFISLSLVYCTWLSYLNFLPWFFCYIFFPYLLQTIILFFLLTTPFSIVFPLSVINNYPTFSNHYLPFCFLDYNPLLLFVANSKPIFIYLSLLQFI